MSLLTLTDERQLQPRRRSRGRRSTEIAAQTPLPQDCSDAGGASDERNDAHHPFAIGAAQWVHVENPLH